MSKEKTAILTHNWLIKYDGQYGSSVVQTQVSVNKFSSPTIYLEEARQLALDHFFEDKGIQKGKRVTISKIEDATVYEVDATYNLKKVKE